MFQVVCRSVDLTAIWIHLINVPSGVQVCGHVRHLDTLNKCSNLVCRSVDVSAIQMQLGDVELRAEDQVQQDEYK